MSKNDECRPSCPCKARDAKEAVERVGELLGVDARAVISMLRVHGWELVKR